MCGCGDGRIHTYFNLEKKFFQIKICVDAEMVAAESRGKSGLQGEMVPDNVRPRQLEGKRNRKQTACKGKGEKVR